MTKTTLDITWEVELDQLTLARFARLVVERDFEHVAATMWATERMTLEGLFDVAVCTHRDRNARMAVLDLGEALDSECLVHLWLVRGHAHVRSGARTADVLSAAKAWVQGRYPVSKPVDEQEVSITFWSRDRYGESFTRRIAVPTWAEVAGNYPRTVAELMSALLERRFGDEHSGRLILWHGPPGTGKTFALRAPFSADEADDWLERRGRQGDGSARTLASL